MQKISKNRGITLVSLIVTIIILMILAGVVFATVTGNNGILSKSKFAKDAYQNSTDEENNTLSKYENEIDKASIDIASSRENYENTTYKETILFENDNGMSLGTVTYIDNHTMSEFDEIRFIYGYAKKDNGGLHEQTFSVSDLQFAIKRTSRFQIALCGYGSRALNINQINEKGFTICNIVDEHVLYLVKGLKY